MNKSYTTWSRHTQSLPRTTREPILMALASSSSYNGKIKGPPGTRVTGTRSPPVVGFGVTLVTLVVVSTLVLAENKYDPRHVIFQQRGILTCVDSDEPVQHPLKLRHSKRCSISSLTVIEYSSD